MIGLDVDPSDADRVVIGDHDGQLWASSDAQATWSEHATTGTMTQTHNPWHELMAMTFSPANPGVLYLGVSSEGGAGTACAH